VGFTLPEILRWLVAHPAEPIGELEGALRTLPQTPADRCPAHVTSVDALLRCSASTDVPLPVEQVVVRNGVRAQ